MGGEERNREEEGGETENWEAAIGGKGRREGRGIMVEGEGKGEEKGGIELEKGRKKLALTSERNFGTIFTLSTCHHLLSIFFRLVLSTHSQTNPPFLCPASSTPL